MLSFNRIRLANIVFVFNRICLGTSVLLSSLLFLRPCVFPLNRVCLASSVCLLWSGVTTRASVFGRSCFTTGTHLYARETMSWR